MTPHDMQIRIEALTMATEIVSSSIKAGNAAAILEEHGTAVEAVIAHANYFVTWLNGSAGTDTH